MRVRERVVVRKLRRAGDSVVVALDAKWFTDHGAVIGEDDVALFYRKDEIILQPLVDSPTSSLTSRVLPRRSAP